MSAEAPQEHKPFISPDENPTEMTLRGLVLGAVLGVVFAASSVYLAVRVGMTVSASIPVAVLSIGVFRFLKGFKGIKQSSILENTIVQTTGSAGESLAFGVAAALPALLFMGYDISLSHALLVAALGGILGVLMMIPLRYGLIVQEHGKLTYPEGTACADVLIVGEKGGTDAKTVIVGFVIGALYKVGYAGLKLWKETIDLPLSWVDAATQKVKGYVGGSISMEVSPELLGVGYIIGLRVAAITFAGGVLSYLILIPAIQFFAGGLDAEHLKQIGVTSGKLVSEMSPGQIRNAFVLYIGAGAVATGGLISLGRSFPTIVGAFKRGLASLTASRAGASGGNVKRTEKDLPITVVLVGSVLLVLAMAIAPPLHVNFLSAALILLFGFFFVTVSSRITGEIGSSSNPISGMVVATLLLICLIFLLLGWDSPQDRFMALTTAAIVGIAASNGGTTAQDLKTAYLVGGTPYRQQIALFVGVLSSAAFIGVTLVLLNQAYTVNIPEPHPNVTLTEVTDETVTAYEAPATFTYPDGVTAEKLASSLWEAGVQVVGSNVRTFSAKSNEELLNKDVKLGAGNAVKLGSFAQLGAGTTQTFKVGFARGVADLPDGRYLLDSNGVVQYVVDPGIGGRISEYMGRKYTRFDAPKARLFSLIIDGILTQKLPWTLVLLGVFIALMLELCGVAALPFAVGVYLPISTSAPIFVGGLVRHYVDSRRKKAGANAADTESESSPGTLLSSGYIAGGAIAGVILAFMTIPAEGAWLKAIDLVEHVGGFLAVVGESETADPLKSTLWGLVFFLGLAIFLGRVGTKKDSNAAA